jgi:hypothetical protein
LLHGGKQVGVEVGERQITAEHGNPLRKSVERFKLGADSNPKGRTGHMRRSHALDEWNSCRRVVSIGKWFVALCRSQLAGDPARAEHRQQAGSYR